MRYYQYPLNSLKTEAKREMNLGLNSSRKFSHKIVGKMIFTGMAVYFKSLTLNCRLTHYSHNKSTNKKFIKKIKHILNIQNIRNIQYFIFYKLI